MNRYFVCHLKNRTLLKIWGVDAFKFLQGLTTNDLNKIITEREFQLLKYPPLEFNGNETLSKQFVKNEDPLSPVNGNVNRLIKGLPSLFLLNNGKVLFDCFIYNIVYTQKKQKYVFFLIDCYKKSVQRLVDLLIKRRLSCDVSFNHLENAYVYQALPCISVLQDQDEQQTNRTVESCDFLQCFKTKKLFFFSKDERNNLLGYRLYQIKHTTDTAEMNQEMRTEEMMEQQEKKTIVQNLIEKVKNRKTKNAVQDTVLYDYFKLHLGIIENLYSNELFFTNSSDEKPEEQKSYICDKKKEEMQKTIDISNSFSNAKSNSGSISGCISGRNSESATEENRKTGNKLSIRKNRFLFQDLTPHDLNYHKLNYLVKNKGCYVGQESVNRIRNKILLPKYELCLLVNSNYYNVFMNIIKKDEKEDFQVWKNVIYNDSICSNYIQQIGEKHMDPSLLKSSFFLLKNILAPLEKIITYKNEYNVYSMYNQVNQNNSNTETENQNECTNPNPNPNRIIGNVFFYNHVMGLTFLIKSKITPIKKELFYKPAKVYIKKEETGDMHNVMLIPLKYKA